jgi:hypothetical protein
MFYNTWPAFSAQKNTKCFITLGCDFNKIEAGASPTAFEFTATTPALQWARAFFKVD